MAYIRRWAEAEYSLAETIFKVVIFSGVRQCGKTTLMRECLPQDAAYVSLDKKNLRQAAEEAPGGFLQQYRGLSCLAIDEVQKVPALFSEIKAFADESPRLRQFLLSGSSNYKTMPTIHESMAGRLGEVRLRPMTEGEIQGRPSRFVERVCNGDVGSILSEADCSKRLIIEKALRGGFPEVLRMQSAQQALQTALQIALRVLLDRARAELVRLVQLRVLSDKRILRQRLFDQPVIHVAQRVHAVQQPRQLRVRRIHHRRFHALDHGQQRLRQVFHHDRRQRLL